MHGGVGVAGVQRTAGSVAVFSGRRSGRHSDLRRMGVLPLVLCLIAGPHPVVDQPGRAAASRPGPPRNHRPQPSAQRRRPPQPDNRRMPRAPGTGRGCPRGEAGKWTGPAAISLRARPLAGRLRDRSPAGRKRDPPNGSDPEPKSAGRAKRPCYGPAAAPGICSVEPHRTADARSASRPMSATPCNRNRQCRRWVRTADDRLSSAERQLLRWPALASPDE